MEVWGNEIDGWDVNNWFNYEVIDASDLDNFEAFCREHLRGDPSQYELIENGYPEIVHAETGKPILQFYPIDDE
jgi:hypothetical protein